MLDLFQRTLSPFQAEIVRKIYASHAPVPNNPTNFVATSQDFSSLKGRRHVFLSGGVPDKSIIPLLAERMGDSQKTLMLRNNRYNNAMLPAHLFLDKLAIPYTTAIFPTSTPKGASQVANVLGISEHQAIKTIIFETDKAERILVMVGGDQNVISGHLKKAADSRNIQLANPEVVLQTTGYQVGSIPPFSWQPEGFRSFLDLDMLNQPILAVGAGVWGNEILITPDNLVRASQAIMINLTDREKPVFLP
jgi:Cys-tRNA(Pro)/Cys-tRNA(Cys) deacylase